VDALERIGAKSQAAGSVDAATAWREHRLMQLAAPAVTTFAAQPPAPPTPEPPPRRNCIYSYFSTDDYPRDARRRHQEGTTRFAITIGTNGRISNCRIVESSGVASLDEATCRIVRERVRYTPARDSPWPAGGVRRRPPSRSPCGCPDAPRLNLFDSHALGSLTGDPVPDDGHLSGRVRRGGTRPTFVRLLHSGGTRPQKPPARSLDSAFSVESLPVATP